MSYVEKHLMPGEQIEYRANLHWLVFLLPILLFIPAVWLFSLGGDIAKVFALILIVGMLVTGLIAVIERRASEFAVTSWHPDCSPAGINPLKHSPNSNPP